MKLKYRLFFGLVLAHSSLVLDSTELEDFSTYVNGNALAVVLRRKRLLATTF